MLRAIGRFKPVVMAGLAAALLAGCTSNGGQAVTVTNTVSDSGSQQVTVGTSDSGATTMPSLESSGGPDQSAPPPSPTAAPKPQVTASPAFGATNLSPSAPISIKVSGGTISDFALTNPQGKQVSGSLSDDKTSWTTGEVLGYGKTYTAKGTATGPDGGTTAISGTFTMLPKSAAVESTISPGDGKVVGIAMPIMITFPMRKVADRATIQKQLTITTTPKVEGSWGWVQHDEGLGVDWRPADYWPAGTKVHVEAKLYGVKLADGKYGAQDLTVDFTIGRAQVTYADVNSHQIVVKQGCTKSNDPGSCTSTVATYPASFGSGSNDNNVTRSGIHVVNDKFEDKLMVGTPPANYRVHEKWAVRISNNGEFIHENPNTVGDQGNTNVSNGCVNLSPENAPKYYNSTIIGDAVEVTGSRIALSGSDADIFDWTVDYNTWKGLSAL